MAIDYKLATKVIDNAIDYTKRGIDSLVEMVKPPTVQYAFAGAYAQNSHQEAGPTRRPYVSGKEPASIDTYMRDSNTPKIVTNPPTAREMLYRLLNF